MAHRDAGRYAAKHDGSAQADERIAEKVRRLGKKEMACPEAEDLSRELGISLAQVGQSLDLLEMKIVSCQLGLFGHGQQGKAVRPAEVVDPLLEGAIRGRISNGRLPCAAAWEISAELGMSRMAVSAACEKLGIKIKPCQLGAF